MRRDDGLDFSGPNVRGDRTDRHLFLARGDVHGEGTLRLIRGSKLMLAGVDPRVVEEAMRPGRQRRRLSRVSVPFKTPGGGEPEDGPAT